MPLLIATDEAGYGPRLGPLVIVATAWQLPPTATPESVHQGLAQAIEVEPYGRVQIDDSKRLFVRKLSKKAETQVPILDLLTDAAASWAAMPLPSEDYYRWLAQLAPDDVIPLQRQPWFVSLGVPPSTAEKTSSASDAETDSGCSESAAVICRKLIGHWSATGQKLIGIAARVIDAARYNQLLDVFSNKAELLSHLTCELALQLWRQHAGGAERTWIYSDRHGGRAYYGGLLQHHCPDLRMRVLQESTQCSTYQLSAEGDAPAPCEIEWAFTVGGDSFAPVALSSIVAKATREQLMQRFNSYFQAEAMQLGAAAISTSLRPTAGYAVDAERFLRDIQPIRDRRSLSDDILIRRR